MVLMGKAYRPGLRGKLPGVTHMRGQDLARLHIWTLTDLDAFCFLFCLHRMQIQLCLGISERQCPQYIGRPVGGDDFEG